MAMSFTLQEGAPRIFSQWNEQKNESGNVDNQNLFSKIAATPDRNLKKFRKDGGEAFPRHTWLATETL